MAQLSEKKVLLIDDDDELLQLLSMRLTSSGFDVETAESGYMALTRITTFRPHLIVTDLRMDGMDGLALFDEVHNKYPTLPVIIITAHATIDDAIAATKRGVYGYLTKPIDSKALIGQIDQALRLGHEAAINPANFDGWRSQIITQSPVIEALLNQARQVADLNASVLIQGNSGTGKELFARAIHDVSQRQDKPFVAVNCNAIPEQLFESELFGHKKGSFTGAISDHIGLFRSADKGTLFLDEIGDMPKPFQVKLLRAIQEMRIRAVGASEDIPVDVRIISATHIDLDKAMTVGEFREDLYYRLNVVSLTIPCLSERREDIPLLVHHFLNRLTDRYDRNVKGFSPEAMECLIHYEWPGNVRQLHNVVEHAVALSTTPLVPVTLVKKALRGEPRAFPSLRDAKNEFERDYIIRLLQITQGNVSQAAKMAKRNRTEFYRLLNRHYIDPGNFKVQ